MAAAWVSMELGTRGPLATEATACAASNMAIGDGLDAIRLGRADAMFCKDRGTRHAGRGGGIQRDARAVAAKRRPGAAPARSTRSATAS